MQIVIDIDEGIAQGIIDGENDVPRNIVRGFQATIADAIKNGTPLPKGHGRLCDLDALQKTYCDNNCGSRKCVDAMDRCIFIDAVLDAPTIIEADKAESEDKE